ncbi:MAG: hypothetical protein QF632_03965 [Candidatus Woesearchaeota archaeon]|nr:hypothetical protein [Candidatus Woesearchaeota archaeon]MDP7323887.1 hypothetical protein [Candidatus Woesearchaeota archaeon]MDP7457207.1 hypothetical protein [Candidatus Woesearchaeota archaeon]|tara:strand:- start:839 stop:1720 length:882 start_codon:yes stop_codon:yes gene_type:complete
MEKILQKIVNIYDNQSNRMQRKFARKGMHEVWNDFLQKGLDGAKSALRANQSRLADLESAVELGMDEEDVTPTMMRDHLYQQMVDEGYDGKTANIFAAQYIIEAWSHAKAAMPVHKRKRVYHQGNSQREILATFILDSAEAMLPSMFLGKRKGNKLYTEGLIHYERGILTNDSSEVQKAISCYEEAIDSGKNDSESNLAAAEAYLRLSEMKDVPLRERFIAKTQAITSYEQGFRGIPNPEKHLSFEVYQELRDNYDDSKLSVSQESREISRLMNQKCEENPRPSDPSPRLENN